MVWVQFHKVWSVEEHVGRETPVVSPRGGAFVVLRVEVRHFEGGNGDRRYATDRAGALQESPRVCPAIREEVARCVRIQMLQRPRHRGHRRPRHRRRRPAKSRSRFACLSCGDTYRSC